MENVLDLAYHPCLEFVLGRKEHCDHLTVAIFALIRLKSYNQSIAGKGFVHCQGKRFPLFKMRN